MLKDIYIKIICFAAFLLISAFSSLGLAGYDYIDITNPFLKKVPLAIPVFKSFTKSQKELQMSVKSSDLLSETLDFTGYFKILDRSAFLEAPQKAGITATNIKFINWTSIGAELLITGGVLIKSGKIEMELRLYDPFKMRLLAGKRYRGWLKDYRRIVRRFCSEVIFTLTGSKGIFNSKIAFVSTGTGNKEIYICDFDGYSPKQLTNSKSIVLFPAWSHDAKWIAYTSYMKGHPDLYIRNLTQKRGAIVARKGINATPAWVPGKFELAATLSFSGDQEIYLLTGGGKIIKRLTTNSGIDSSPTWCPDGRRIAFVSKRSGTPQIYIKNFDTGQVRRLTYQGKYNTQPSWSPNGNKIAYSSMGNGQINIFVIGVDGSGLIQLTENSGNNESPTWAPDGSLIAFSSTREGISKIYVMTAYGTDQRRLLSLPGEQTNPAWSPAVPNN